MGMGESELASDQAGEWVRVYFAVRVELGVGGRWVGLPEGGGVTCRRELADGTLWDDKG